jgi:hypothetical protein
MAYFVAKVGVCTKPSVEILATISINIVSFLAILFVTFEYYRNLAPDRQIKKPWFTLKSKGWGHQILIISWTWQNSYRTCRVVLSLNNSKIRKRIFLKIMMQSC